MIWVKSTDIKPEQNSTGCKLNAYLLGCIVGDYHILPPHHMTWADGFIILKAWHLNTLKKPRQNSRYFADDTFKCIFMNENVWIYIKVSHKLIHKGPFDNIPALVQIIAWRWPGDEPLSEPMIARLLMHIWVTRPQWIYTFMFIGTCI